MKQLSKKNLSKGILIAIEGIDGSGKTTLAKNLYQYLINDKYPAILTKEPGGTSLGKKLREIVQGPDLDITNKSEYLLFAADRYQHFTEVIVPALNEKKIIISDRSDNSSLAYQGYGRGLDLDMIKKLNSWTMNNITQDIIFYVKVDIETAFKRLEKRNEILTTFETKSFIQNVAKGFDEIFKAKQNVIVIDGEKSPNEILNQTIKYLQSWI